MFILYFDGQFHEYYHATVYAGWTDYAYWRPGEGLWLVPGTDHATVGQSYETALMLANALVAASLALSSHQGNCK